MTVCILKCVSKYAGHEDASLCPGWDVISRTLVWPLMWCCAGSALARAPAVDVAGRDLSPGPRPPAADSLRLHFTQTIESRFFFNCYRQPRCCLRK